MLADRPRLRAIWEIAREVGDQWRADRVAGVGAEVAFWLALSIFPGLLVTAALLGSMEPILGADVAQDAEKTLISELEATLGGDGGIVADSVRDLFSGTNASVLTVGVVVAIVSASRGFGAVVRALDVVYDVERYRSWFHIRLTALGLAAGTIVVVTLMLAMLVVGPLLGLGAEVADDLGVASWFDALWRWGRLPAMALIVIGWAATIYHLGPLHHSPWRWDLPGAVLAAVGWVAATLGFRLYLGTVGTDNAIFGAVGTMLSLLLWVYLLSVTLILGAEVNQVLARRYGVRRVAQGSTPPSERLARLRRWAAERGYGDGG